MSERIDLELERRLASLGREMAEAAPSPSDDLMARILADAGEVAAERRAGALRPETARPSRWRWSSAAIFPIWTGGAIAVMCLGLILGIGVGYGYGDRAMALTSLDRGLAFAAMEDGFLASDGPF